MIRKLHATCTCIMKLVSPCNRTFILMVFFPRTEISSRYLRWVGCDRSRTRGLQCWWLFGHIQGFQLLYTCTFLDEVNFEWAYRVGRITFCLSDSSYCFLKNMVMILTINGVLCGTSWYHECSHIDSSG
jgi:hypothetical protein